MLILSFRWIWTRPIRLYPVSFCCNIIRSFYYPLLSIVAKKFLRKAKRKWKKRCREKGWGNYASQKNWATLRRVGDTHLASSDDKGASPFGAKPAEMYARSDLGITLLNSWHEVAGSTCKYSFTTKNRGVLATGREARALTLNSRRADACDLAAPWISIHPPSAYPLFSYSEEVEIPWNRNFNRPPGGISSKKYGIARE